MNSSNKPRRFVRFLVHSWPGTVIVLLVGLVIGFWAGGFTSCAGKGCEVRVDSMEALGTWVGGLGTIAAVIYAAAAFRHDHEKRAEAAHEEAVARKRKDLAELRDAEQVTVRCQIGGSTPYPPNVQVTEFRVFVENGANTEPLFKLSGHVPGFGPLSREKRLEAGAQAVTQFRKPRTPNMPFTILSGEERQYERARARQVSISFEMHNRLWRRIGDDPIEEVLD